MQRKPEKHERNPVLPSSIILLNIHSNLSLEMAFSTKSDFLFRKPAEFRFRSSRVQSSNFHHRFIIVPPQNRINPTHLGTILLLQPKKRKLLLQNRHNLISPSQKQHGWSMEPLQSRSLGQERSLSRRPEG